MKNLIPKNYFHYIFRISLSAVVLFAYSCKNSAGDLSPEFFLLDSLAAPTYSISGTVHGLTGDQNFVLSNQAVYRDYINSNSIIDTVSLAGNGPSTAGLDLSFTFNTELSTDSTYSVGVQDYPLNPAQICTIAGESGTVSNADITNVVVNCGDGYLLEVTALADTTTGILGSGLIVSHLGTDGSTESLQIPNPGQHAFHTPIYLGTNTDLTVDVQPSNPWQTCTFTPSTITAPGGANPIATTQLQCLTNTYSVGGTIADLYETGLGLQLDYTYNGTPGTLTANPGINATSYTFGNIESSSTYTASITSQPAGSTCSIPSAASTGTVGGGSVSIPVNCSFSTIQVDGTVTDLRGSGLNLNLSYTQNSTGATGGENITVPAGSTSYAFSGAIPYDSNVTVTITGDTTTNPSQSCAFAGPTLSHTFTTGSTNYTLPDIICTTDTYTLSGNVLSGEIIDDVTLTVNWNNPVSGIGSDTATITLGHTGTFDFTSAPLSLESGTTYTTVITNQHAAQQCSIASGSSGTITTANQVVELNCSPLKVVQVNVSNYLGSGLELDIGGALETVPAGTTTYVSPQVFDTSSTLTSFGVNADPTNPWQTCTWSGTPALTYNFSGGNYVTSVSCVTNQYSIGVNISGYTVVPSVSGDRLKITNSYDSAVTTFASSTGSLTNTPFDSGTTHNLTITNPVNPWYTCAFDDSGTGASSATITNTGIIKTITCTEVQGSLVIQPTGVTSTVPLNYAWTPPGGSLSSSSLNVISAQNGSNVAVTNITNVHAGGTYTVSIASQPDPDRFCSLSPDPATGILQPGTNAVALDCTNRPTVTSITTTHGTRWNKAADVISLTLNFSENVNASGVSIALNTGGTASCTNASGVSSLTCTYTVGAGQNSANASTPINKSSTTAITGTVTSSSTGLAAYLTYTGSITFNGGTNVYVDTGIPSPPVSGAISNPSAGRVNFAWTNGTDTLSGWASNRYSVCDGTICEPYVSTTLNSLSLLKLTGKQYYLQVQSVDAAGNRSNITTTASIKSGLRLFISSTPIVPNASSMAIMDSTCTGDSSMMSNPSPNVKALVAFRTLDVYDSSILPDGGRRWGDVINLAWKYYSHHNASGGSMFSGNPTFIPTSLSTAVYPGNSTPVLTGFNTSNALADFRTCGNYRKTWNVTFTYSFNTGIPASQMAAWIFSGTGLPNQVLCNSTPVQIYCVEEPR